jgi:hypothetical protein
MSCDNVEGSGFTRPVGADQSSDSSRLYRKIHAVDGMQSVKFFAEVLDREQHFDWRSICAD